VILQSFSDLQKNGQLGIDHGDRQEEKTNGAYGSRSQRRHNMEKDDTVIGGRSLDTPKRSGSAHVFYSSSYSERHHHHHLQHLYKRSEKQYFPEEFKK